MGFFKRTEKILVITNYFSLIDIWNIDCINKWFSDCAIYLYNILKMESNNMSTAILGISAYYHDSAAAIIINGEIIAAAHEERFTRKKT